MPVPVSATDAESFALQLSAALCPVIVLCDDCGTEPARTLPLTFGGERLCLCRECAARRLERLAEAEAERWAD